MDNNIDFFKVYTLVYERIDIETPEETYMKVIGVFRDITKAEKVLKKEYDDMIESLNSSNDKITDKHNYDFNSEIIVGYGSEAKGAIHRWRIAMNTIDIKAFD